ncbi:MAG: LysM peptidoglycan-binding domain-containing protein [Actinomycetota bacterium]
MANPKKIVAPAAVVAVIGAFALLPVDPSSAHPTHVVEPGDSLSEIAEAHGLSTRSLADANGIGNANQIRIGQTLVIPGDVQLTYTVESGDTVSGIARRFGVRTSEIVSLNGITNPDQIRLGQTLKLPSGADEESMLALYAARYPNLPRSITDNPERLRLVPVFERWAKANGISVDLLMAMAYQESGWQDDVVSSAGAVGVGQLMPVTSEWVAGELIGEPGLDPYDPEDNVRMSARFMRWLIIRMGSESKALAGYYQGPTSVAARGAYPVTDAYVASVTNARARFQSS